MQNAFVGAPESEKRRSVVAPLGSETDVLPDEASRAPLPELLRQPPMVPGAVLFEQGQLVQPI